MREDLGLGLLRWVRIVVVVVAVVEMRVELCCWLFVREEVEKVEEGFELVG